MATNKPPLLNITKTKSPGSKTTLDSPIEQVPRKFAGPALQTDEGTHDIIVLDLELDTQIAKVLKEKEVDKSSTNIRQKVANQVNELFPTEESIAGSDAELEKLKLQIKELDDELRQLISTKHDRNTPEIISQIKKEIQDLVKKIQIIKTKAAQCEKTVVEITRDIKSLDETKKNLSSAMTLIKRIHLTANALEYMKGMANRKQYGNVADVLRIIVRVYAPLKDYKDNEQLLFLCEKMMLFENEIKKSIFTEFEGAFNGGTIALQADTLNEACYVLESLEMDAKNQLIRWYVEMQLTDYRNLFRKNPEVAGLTDISRRYAWLKRSLKTFDENHAVLFPEHWKVADALSWQFCQDTKRDLAEVIMKSERDGSFDTRIMLGAIQTTTEFEAKLDHRFIQQIYEEGQTILPEVADRYTRIISSVYDSFLWHYIDMEDQVMTEKFETFRRSLGEIEEGVYGTSLELFLFYRQTFANCGKLSTGKPFLDLCKMYQKWLEHYKELLLSKLSKDERKVPNNDELLQICSILNTSDYCGITTGQLEEKLIETINKEFKGLVSFTAEVEAFTVLTGTALISLVRGVENILDSALITMTKKSWYTTTTVGDQSEHITAIAQSLSSVIPNIRKQLTSPKFFKSFCDKFVESFLSKFLNTISTRCKPISEVGAEQMLLDTHSLNNILIAMTNHGAEEKTPPSASFTKILGKGIAKIDQLLKVVLRPHEPAAPIIETYMLLFQDHSAAGFQKILELKGIRRIEMNSILEQYSQRLTPAITVASAATSSPSLTKTFSSNFFARTATISK